MLKKKGFTIIELAVVAGIFLLMIMLLAPVVQAVKARSRRVKCQNNLMTISLGLHAYAADHDDLFPPKLGDIYPKYVGDEKVFNCPGAKAAGTPDNPEYKYIVGLTESVPLKEIIVEDLDSNHKGFGRHVLRVDGSVEWVAGAR